MKVGTRSILFGVHQFIWHPITVWLAWRKLFGKPTWAELAAIVMHDWGYWGLSNMDGEEGKRHPRRSMSVAWKLLSFTPLNFRIEVCSEIIAHSRWYCRAFQWEESKLCAADKLSMAYDPEIFYLLRATLSGELKEYKSNAAPGLTNHEWFRTLRQRAQKYAHNYGKNERT